MTTPALNGLEEESRSRWWQWSANAGEQINKRPQTASQPVSVALGHALPASSSCRTRVRRDFRVIPGSRGAADECCPYIPTPNRSAERGAVPGRGVDRQRLADVALEGCATGDEVDRLIARLDVLESDPLSSRSALVLAYSLAPIAVIQSMRMSRVPWNFGGGPVMFRRRPPCCSRSA